MKAKDVDKITKYYSEIKELDNKIIELDKAAKLISESGEDVKISISLPDVRSKKKVLDEDGSLISGESRSPFSFYLPSLVFGGPDSKEDKDTNKLKETIPDTLALQIFAVLIREKSERRKALINEITKLGVSL